MKSVSTYVDMAQTAVQEPERVPPFLRYKTSQTVKSGSRKLTARMKTRDLPGQKERLDQLRDNEEYMLIVLDACRLDELLREFDHWFRGSIEGVRSEGHDTFEYVRECWPGEYDVTYCSGATPINSEHVEYEIDAFNELYGGYRPLEHISNIVDVWATGWDESLGTCPPWAVTNAALDRCNEKRLVAHYFQPHAPYIARENQLLGYTDSESARPFAGEPIDKPVWEAVKFGPVTDEELRQAYRANLRCALREVARLVEQVPHEEIVIMGDHGEALGEWDVYSHPRMEHLHIRRIPWARVDGLSEYGRDQLTEAGGDWADGQQSDGSVEQRLKQLGYI